MYTDPPSVQWEWCTTSLKYVHERRFCRHGQPLTAVPRGSPILPAYISRGKRGLVLAQDVGRHGRDVVTRVRLAREKDGAGLARVRLELRVELEKVRQEPVELLVHLNEEQQKKGRIGFGLVQQGEQETKRSWRAAAPCVPGRHVEARCGRVFADHQYDYTQKPYSP